MEIHPVGAELFHVDGYTERERERERHDEEMVGYCNLGNAPKNILSYVYKCLTSSRFPASLRGAVLDF